MVRGLLAKIIECQSYIKHIENKNKESKLNENNNLDHIKPIITKKNTQIHNSNKPQKLNCLKLLLRTPPIHGNKEQEIG